jgi:hypothetical protein
MCTVPPERMNGGEHTRVPLTERAQGTCIGIQVRAAQGNGEVTGGLRGVSRRDAYWRQLLGLESEAVTLAG